MQTNATATSYTTTTAGMARIVAARSHPGDWPRQPGLLPASGARARIAATIQTTTSKNAGLDSVTVRGDGLLVILQFVLVTGFVGNQLLDLRLQLARAFGQFFEIGKQQHTILRADILAD